MRTTKLLIAAAFITIPVWGSIPAHPGMLNYVEGQANIDGRPVTNKSVGSADVEQGKVIETGNGKAEILLTPGVFLRLGVNSAVRMTNPGLADTSVELLRGEAMVEATDLHKANHIEVLVQGSTTTLDKNGLYSFKADQPEVAVYDGKATVNEGDRHKDIGKGKEVAIADIAHTTHFDAKQGDDLYRWSDLRSEYLSEASVSSASNYVSGGLGWAWNPYFGFYSYLPGDGFLYSPFGWGFYSPGYLGLYGGGFYGGGYGYGGGYYRGGGYRGPVTTRGFVGAGRAPSASFARSSGGFGGGGGFRSGGFSGGGARGGRR